MHRIHSWRTSSRTATLVAAMVFMVGCGGEEVAEENSAPPVEAESPAPPPAGPQNPPEIQRVFDDAAAALVAEDYGKFSGHLTDESQAALATVLVSTGGQILQFSKIQEELSALTGGAGGSQEVDALGKVVEQVKSVMEKHGVAPPDPAASLQPPSTDAIVDKPGFIGEMITVLKSAQTATGISGMVAVGQPISGQLANVVVMDDTATGVLVQGAQQTPIEFKQVEGQWKIHVPELIAGASPQ